LKATEAASLHKTQNAFAFGHPKGPVFSTPCNFDYVEREVASEYEGKDKKADF